MSDLTEFPTLGLTDYLADDLATVYQVTEKSSSFKNKSILVD
jgi:hypothetical protein